MIGEIWNYAIFYRTRDEQNQYLRHKECNGIFRKNFKLYWTENDINSFLKDIM